MQLTPVEREALEFCFTRHRDQWAMPAAPRAAAQRLYKAGLMDRLLYGDSISYRTNKAGRHALEEQAEPDHQKVIAALAAGRVDIDPGAAEAIGRMDLANPDFTLTKTTLSCCWGPFDRNDGGFEITWESKSAGCGRIVVVRDKDGRLRCQNQAVGPQFLKAVLAHLIDGMELEDK